MTLLGALTAEETRNFHLKAEAAFKEAVSRRGCSRLTTVIAGIEIDIETAGEDVMAALRPALAGIASLQAAPPVARILVFDVETSGVAAPIFDRPIQHLIRWRGDCWSEPSARCRVVFHMSDFTLQVFDPETATCVVIIRSVAKLPPWTLAAPLRSSLAMILEAHGVLLVHGAAVGYPTGAVLITGYGGNGKSTTTLSCYKAGMSILGDDYVAIRPPRLPDQLPTVYHVFSSLKIVPQEIGEGCGTKRVQDKRILYPFETSDEGLLRGAPLSGVISAEIVDAPAARIIPAAPEGVARIAFASTALQIPMANEATAAKAIDDCVRLAGAYKIELGRDRSSAAWSIAALLAEPHCVPTVHPPAAWQRAGALKPISAIIPVHNGSDFIGEALASIVAQDYPELEILVVDDGSTDDLDEALSRIPHSFKLIRQPQRGPAAARNTGIQNARNEWLAFLDADDMWIAGALDLLAKDLALHEQAGVVRGSAVTFRRDPETDSYVNAYHPRESYPFFIGGGLYRRSSFDAVGLFDGTLKFAEDTDWYWRATEAGLSIINIADIILKIRMHDANMTADQAAAERGGIQALKRRIQRSRLATKDRLSTNLISTSYS